MFTTLTTWRTPGPEEELYRSLGTFKTPNEEYRTAIRHMGTFCKYKAPARFGGIVTVTLSLGERSEKTIRYDFEIHRKSDGELLCSGHITMIGLDLRNWKTTELPPDLIGKVATAPE